MTDLKAYTKAKERVERFKAGEHLWIIYPASPSPTDHFRADLNTSAAYEASQVKQVSHSATEIETFNFDVSETVALTSIAISLKRIADAMTADNEYGEHGSQAIYGAIKRGLRER